MESLEGRALFSSPAAMTLPPLDEPHITDPQAEVLARVTAYETNLQLGSNVLTGANYVVDRLFDDSNDGFEAVGLVSPTNAPVLAIRGTETSDPHDVAADANPRGVGFNQFSDNWLGRHGVRAWLNSFSQPTSGDAGGPVDIVGHSLGGALAQWIAAAYTHQGHDVGRVVTFNSPGISSSYAKKFVPSRSLGVTDYISSGDIVSMAGQAFISGEYRLVHFDSQRLLGSPPTLTGMLAWELAKHTTPMLTSAAGGTVPPDLIIDNPVSTSSGLNSRTFVYADPEYSLARQSLSAAIQSTPILPKYWRTIPMALGARWSTEADRPRLFKVLFGFVA